MERQKEIMYLIKQRKNILKNKSKSVIIDGNENCFIEHYFII